MATKTVSFLKSRYLSLHPNLNREIFVRNLLLPGLKKQGRLGLGSPGVELPTGEFITLGEAKDLIFDFLINDANLGERDQKALRGVLSHTSFVDLADSYLNREVTEPKTLGATITPDQVEALQSSKVKPTVNHAAQFSSDQTIRDYNALYQKILLYSGSGNSAQILARLFPAGVSSATNISQVAMAQVITSNLVRLREAAQVSDNPEVQNHAVAQEFSRILSNHPEIEGYRNFLGNRAIQATLHGYVDSIAEQAIRENPSALQDLDRLQLSYGQKLKTYLLNESELHSQIYNQLPLIRDNERLTLTAQILREITKGSRDGISIQNAVKNLGLDATTQAQVTQSLEGAGLKVSLNYYQGRIRVMLDSHELTNGELKLLKKGINPFLTTSNPHSDKLVGKENQILSEYNSKTNKQFVTLREAYLFEKEKANSDPLFLIHARDILNRQSYYDSLTPKERRQVESTRFGRWVSNTTSRIRNAQDKLTDSVFDLVDTVTGKKWLYKQWDKVDAFAAKIYIPGTKIPLFRINSWVASQLESWKKVKAKQFITHSSSWNGSFGKWFHRRAKDYELGGFTVRGMAQVGIHRAWSNFAYKASGKIVKGGLIASERTLRRLLIKVGGKALAKLTFEAVATLSGIFTAVGIVLIIKDVLDLVGGAVKWGWEQLKKVFGGAEGALAAVITGATVWLAGAWTIGTTFLLGLFSSFILPGVVGAGWAIGIALGAMYLFTHQGGDGFNMSIHLDSGISSLVSSVICDQSKQTTSSATANVALCIADIVNNCPGLNPITVSKLSSSSWQCLVGGLVFKNAITELEKSAHVSNGGGTPGNVQCVGLSAASAADGDGAFSVGQINACQYAHNTPNGYHYLTGCPNMQPGDQFIMAANDCSGYGGNKVGHIGVVIDPSGGEKFTCVDANYSFAGNGVQPGEIRGPDKCYFAKSEISGCLRKI